MSGRRLRTTVRETLLQNGFDNSTTVVIAGLSNAYSHYITTFEEFGEFFNYEFSDEKEFKDMKERALFLDLTHSLLINKNILNLLLLLL